jgi:glucan phosphoethanolaminetransferase (alkaline phosphatase superfamily)
LLWAIRRKVWSLINKKHAIGISIIVVFGMLFVLVFTQQIIYATGFGAFNVRYLLPAWPVIGLCLAFGVSAWPKLRGLGVMLMTLIGWVALINWTVFNLTNRTDLPTGQGRLHLLQANAVQNGFPPEIVPGLLFTLLVGLILVAIALWKLTDPKTRKYYSL